MSKKKTKEALIAFRVEQDVADRFDEIAESLGSKRQQILREFMRVFTGRYSETSDSHIATDTMVAMFATKELMELLKQVHEKIQDVVKYTPWIREEDR